METSQVFYGLETSRGPPHQLSINSKLVTKASIIASEMNTYFIKKVRVIREGIAFLGNQFTLCKEIMVNKHCKLNFKHVSVQKVNNLLKKLKNSKSTSIDELDNFCVKLAADIIDKPLHHVITLSIISSKF